MKRNIRISVSHHELNLIISLLTQAVHFWTGSDKEIKKAISNWDPNKQEHNLMRKNHVKCLKRLLEYVNTRKKKIDSFLYKNKK